MPRIVEYFLLSSSRERERERLRTIKSVCLEEVKKREKQCHQYRSTRSSYMNSDSHSGQGGRTFQIDDLTSKGLLIRHYR
jgi:hypothetical protein